jgi:hypothetical protein
MKPLSSPEHRILVLERFNGFESYPIELAEWNLYKDEKNGMMNLWICLSAGAGTIQHEDTEYLNGKPNWELNLVEPNLSEESIRSGFTATIPECYDESRDGWITVFYFCSHEGTDKNTIEIIEVDVDGDRVRFRIGGETIDVNYYDGSKPPTKLTVDGWFQRNRDGKRSMK